MLSKMIGTVGARLGEMGMGMFRSGRRLGRTFIKNPQKGLSTMYKGAKKYTGFADNKLKLGEKATKLMNKKAVTAAVVAPAIAEGPPKKQPKTSSMAPMSGYTPTMEL